MTLNSRHDERGLDVYESVNSANSDDVINILAFYAYRHPYQEPS